MNYLIFIITSSFLIINCATTTIISTSGGFGENITNTVYEYEIHNLQVADLFSNISFVFKIKRFNEQSPIDAELNYIINCLRIEIEDNQGLVVDKEESLSDIFIDIVLSKYITRKFDRNNYKTFIDLEYVIFDNVSNKSIITKPISISGSGFSPSESNLIAIKKITKSILLNKKLRIILLNIYNSSDNNISHLLNRLSKSLLIDFEKIYASIEEENNFAFVGFENDTNLLFSSNFLTSLMNYWESPQYNFFSRDQLDKVIDEYDLYQVGILENNLFLKELELKSVEFIITGKVTNINQQYMVEALIIDIRSGEIITSKSVSIIL